MKQHTFIKKIISLLKKSIMNRITLDGILANKLFLYSIIIVFLCLRFCNLNQDAPSMMISSICEEDEAYYSVEGINQYNVEHNRYIKGFEKSMIAPLLIYSKSITYICLNIFGNNFYGLRVPVVLISILFLLFLFIHIVFVRILFFHAESLPFSLFRFLLPCSLRSSFLFPCSLL